ncbi:phage holin family protein [Nocardioides sp. InS609-2]|uniref:phage holin family protein n=1 Tax=Nocardioides sp. InS609-2 TaxID=2760705 RepID=UPI0020BE88CA|nr:phage holin family protein [Nocardioides sp. InS609-2]
MTDTPDIDSGPIEPSSSAARATASVPDASDATTGQLVSRLSQEVSELVRGELQLAKVEMTGKAKAAGIGAGLFGGAGVIALYGLGVLIATVILALSLVLDAWLAALIVAVVLFAVAGVTALMGKKRVQEAAPVTPTETVDSVKKDVRAVKGARKR